MPLELVTIPCLSDNYAYILHDRDSGQTAVVDVPEPGPILAALQARQWRLTDILITHHHPDHIQGVDTLRAATGAMVLGAAADAHRLPRLDLALDESSSFSIGREFARAEGIAFVTGDGVNKPRGFLTAANSAADDNARPFGTLQFVTSGAAAAFAATNPQDRLIDLVHSLAAPYRQGAKWVMNSATLARVRKMKDLDGGFIWQPALAADQPATLLGYPVIEVAAMPDVAADSLSIAFGNFQAGYIIAQRRDTVVLRDPFTNKPFVNFYATKRVGGTVVDSRAIKLMRFNV